MKLAKGFFKLIICCLLLLAIALISCEQEEISISGDSSFFVKNELSVDAQIYFEEDFIGEVKKDDSRRWSVPSGSHTVKADCSYKGDIEKTAFFPKGGEVKLTLFD
jgi:hypothetical protein